jgi:hypothetical protein
LSWHFIHYSGASRNQELQMSLKMPVAMALLLFPILSAAQVQPPVKEPLGKLSAGAGMDYWSGDWGNGDVNRWGPAVWGTLTIWRGLGINVEGHSMFIGGNQTASSYKYFVGEGGLFYMSRHWKRFQPFAKAEAGFGSLSYPSNGTGQTHLTSNTRAIGGGLEVLTWRRLWTRVDYTYDSIPNFHSSITNAYHTLNPRGLTLGETIRF